MCYPLRIVISVFIAAAPASATFLLVPMDMEQTDHLRAYGVAYQAVADGAYVEWLLNYRGGSFLIEDYDGLAEMCAARGVYGVFVADPGPIYAVIEDNNMEAVPLDKAPRIALYAPEETEVWDDSVMRALEYALIPYDRVWNDDVLSGRIYEYDWLHLHHEDFTGQFGKFYSSFGGSAWYELMVAEYNREAANAGYPSVAEYLKAVARALAEYVYSGGFLFAMCSATDTIDIALAAADVDIVESIYDGDPPDPHYNEKLDYSATMAFTDFTVYPNIYLYEFSNIDTPRSIGLVDPSNPGSFTLFEFSAKSDTVPTILTQCHTARITEFMGQTTAFRREVIKKNVVVLATVDGYEEAKYIYGNYGEGFFSFYAGHDPEDFQHFIGEPPTDLSYYPHSPGYRLILNNILFPAARKEELKT
jgi:hypothetical protein